MTSRRIAEGVHHVADGFVNVYLVEAEQGLVLVDTGMRGDARAIANALRSLGRAAGAVTDVLLTHHHADHTGGLATVVEHTGARVHVHAADAPVVDGTGSVPLPDRSTWRGRVLGPRVVSDATRATPVPVHRTFVDGDELDVAGGVRVVHTPGHTAGQSAFVLPRGGGVLLAGDAATHLVRLRPGIFGFDAVVAADLAQQRASFAALAGLDVEVAAFGHGRPILGGASERLRAAVRRGH